MALIKNRVSMCLTGTAGITAAERQQLKALAEEYATGDPTQDYILAVNDVLTYLRETRAAVAKALDEARTATTKEAAQAKEEADAIAKLEAEAEARDEAEADRRAQFASKGQLAQEVLDTIDIVDTMTSRELIKTPGRKKYVAALAWLFDSLHSTDANLIRTGAVAFIEQFLKSVPKNALYREAIMRTASNLGVITAMIVNNKTKTERANPFFTAIIQAGMYNDVARVATFRNPPAEYAKASTVPSPEKLARDAPRTKREKFSYDAEADAELESPGNDTATADTSAQHEAAMALATEIKNINARVDTPNAAIQKQLTDKLKRLWKAVVAEGTEDFTDEFGNPLSSYFENGSPKTQKLAGYFQVVTEVESTDARAQVEAELRAERKAEKARAKAAEQDDYSYTPTNTFDTWTGEGGYFRDDGTPLTQTVPPGRIRMMVNAFLRKLAIKPTVHIYKSQADLKARNPELYARAAASRPQGDFDTTSAVGFSFGKGEVIIFSDRVRTEKELNFVLAHETLGHFGFRGVMPGAEFNSIMEKIYDSSAHVRAVVDAAMAAHGMSKAEAVEEYLADFAGTLETNLLKRVWYAVKGFLNKLGVTFEDDMARYVVSQARAYVRNGTLGGVPISAEQISQRVLAMESLQDPYGTGRYFQRHESYSDSNRMAADMHAGRIPDPDRNEAATAAGISEKVKEWAEDKGIDTKDFFNRVLGELKTMNYAARENQGYRRMYDILRATVHMATKLRSKYNTMMHTALQLAVELPDWMGGVNLSRMFISGAKAATRADLRSAMEMLRITSLVKMRQFTDKDLNAYGPLFVYDSDGVLRRTDAVRELAAKGRFTIQELRDGFEYTDFAPQPMTAEYKQQITADYEGRIQKAKDVKEVKRLQDERDSLLAENSYNVPVTRKFAGIDGLTEDSPAWKVYNEVRDTMDESALDLLESNFAAAKGERENVLRAVQKFLGREPTKQNEEFVQSIVDKYLTLRDKKSSVSDTGEITLDPDSTAAAQRFIELFNAAVIGTKDDRTADNAKLMDFFEKSEYDDVRAGVAALKAKANIAESGQRRYVMQHAIQNMAMFELGKSDAELHAKQSIAHGYVPFGREGAWQVRIVAKNPKTGRVYKIKDGYREKLLYMQMEKKSEALRTAKYVNDIFGDANEDGLFAVEVLTENGEWEIKNVKLEAVATAAMTTPSVVADVNLNDVISTITQFSIELRPQEREKLIQGLTSQNARARTRLRRTGAPGEDPNFLKYVSQHLEAVASTVARKHHRHMLTRLFDDGDGDSERLWYGDREHYDRLKGLWESAKDNPAVPEALKQSYKREFEDYHNTFVRYDSREMGGRYKNRAHRLMAFLDAQKDVEFTDFGSGELTSKIRMWTTFAMLGASPATAILNYLSLPMNVLPAMSGRNSKNGFGGGYGLAASSAELTYALSQTGNMNQSDYAYWKSLTDDVTGEKAKAAGFTPLEAEFMLREVGSGAMQAALTNALLGSARGKITSGRGQKLAQGWMFLFNYSEQMARRATGLATYRLEYKRSMLEAQAKGMGEVAATEFAHERATKVAVEMIENTLGEYAMFNRPALFRGGVGQFIFMFKMYSINTIQMLASLPPGTQLAAIGLLLLMSGLKGLPFAEDMMDILDAVAQFFGFGPRGVWKGSAEKSLANMLDSVAPGLTPYALRGVMNSLTPANTADRVSLGNILPATGVTLAGADVGRELIEVLGPFASFTQGMLASSADLAKWVGDPSVQGFADIARASPVTMARAAGDSWTFYETGAIVNRRGYVVSPDLHAGVIAARMLGFYPSEAVRQNDVVRVSTRLGNYRKEIAGHFYSKYVVAKMSKDRDAVNSVLQRVDAWNERAKGTDLELTNFRQSAERAYKAATMTATQRYLRTTPKGVRKETERTMEMLGVEN